MIVFLRLLKPTLSPFFALCLSIVGCSAGEGSRVAAAGAEPGVELVDICPMLDGDAVGAAGTDSCDPWRIVSLIEPGPLNDRVRDGEVGHGLGADPVGGGRMFTGADDDVVLTDIAAGESNLLNPNGNLFVFQAWLTMNRRQMDALRVTEQPSWNVVQRGFADSAGGQWKLSLVTIDGAVQAQCVVRDGDGEVLRVHSRYDFRPDVEAAVTCIFDDRNTGDTANELRIVVNRTDGDRDRTTDSGAVFGDVAPHDPGSGCWADVADQLAVGNKPRCGSTPLTDDDRFQGTIRQVRVLRPHLD